MWGDASKIVMSHVKAGMAGAHAEPEKFIRFIAEAELETEKDFIRALGLEMPDLKNI